MALVAISIYAAYMDKQEAKINRAIDEAEKAGRRRNKDWRYIDKDGTARLLVMELGRYNYLVSRANTLNISVAEYLDILIDKDRLKTGG